LTNRIYKYQPNFHASDTIDSKIKVLSFITYFVYLELNASDINATIDLLDQHQIIGTYIEMMKNNNDLQSTKSIIDKITSLSLKNKERILATYIYANPLAKLLEPLFKDKNIQFKIEEATRLFDLIIKLLLINYHTPQMKALAAKNLKEKYQQKIEFTIVQTTFISEIHKSLRIITPKNIDSLVIFLNYSLKKMKQ
jgi:hypothetical protein